MAKSYTDKQIKYVCRKAIDTMHGYTSPQNCTFPTNSIIKGMKGELKDGEGNDLTAEGIADAARNEVCDLDLRQTGFGLVGMGDNMLNISNYMRGAVLQAIKDIDDNAVTEAEIDAYLEKA